jgi:hypothetical protein
MNTLPDIASIRKSLVEATAAYDKLSPLVKMQAGPVLVPLLIAVNAIADNVAALQIVTYGHIPKAPHGNQS